MILLRNHFITLLLLTLLSLPGFSQNQNILPSDVIHLNPPAFKKGLEKQRGFVLDVRTPAEFAQGHLPNAINLNYQYPNFANYIKVLKPGKPYFAYCAVGGRSVKACKLLKANGLANVYNLAGGIKAWQQAGQPVVRWGNSHLTLRGIFFEK